MKIYVAHSKEFDYEKELYKPIRQSHLNDKHTFILPHENINLDLREFLKNECELVIAEVSYTSTIVSWDLGSAYILKLPIRSIHRKGTEVPVEFRYVSRAHLEYSNSKDMISKIEKIIKEFEKEIIKNN